MDNSKEIKNFVKDRYGKIASSEESCCPGCGCSNDPAGQAKAAGYSEQELSGIPEEAVMGLGCGNPAALAELKEGETVVDLGSGGGIDVFLAAKRVGETGRVIGIDMTEEMIEKARENAGKGGYTNVDFRFGEIENLPLDDNSTDVILSNCVINLTPDKLAAYKEAFRVLKPGGRILISDLVTETELSDGIRKSFDAWAECLGGAMVKQDYLNTIGDAGFRDIRVVGEKAYSEPGMDERLAGKIISIQVRAIK